MILITAVIYIETVPVLYISSNDTKIVSKLSVDICLICLQIHIHK